MKQPSPERVIIITIFSIIQLIGLFALGFPPFLVIAWVTFFIVKLVKVNSRSGLSYKILFYLEEILQNFRNNKSSTIKENVVDVSYTDKEIGLSYKKLFINLLSSIMLNIKSIIIYSVAFIFTVSIVTSSYFIVQPGEVAFLVRFGNIQASTYDSGIFIKIPWVDKVVRINTQIQKNEATANSASSDLQDVSAEVALNYSIDRNKAKELYRRVGNEEVIQQKLISPAIQESIKAATAKYVASQLITDRVNARADMIKLLKEKLEPSGILVTDLNIVDFRFSAAFNQAIESKVRAEQDALAEKNKLEQIKYQAQQKIETAKAEAEKIKIQAEAITKQGGKEYVQLQRIEKWDGKLPKIATSDNGGMLLQISGDDL